MSPCLPVGHRGAIPVLNRLEIVPHRGLVTNDFSLLCEFQIARVRRHGAAIEDPAALTADLVESAAMRQLTIAQMPVADS